MTVQQYLMVNESTNVVENLCVWDGDTSTWQPPANTLMLVAATTPAMVWVTTRTEIEPPTNPITYNYTFTLEEVMGAGGIGFTWNGSILTTNQQKPSSN